MKISLVKHEAKTEGQPVKTEITMFIMGVNKIFFCVHANIYKV